MKKIILQTLGTLNRDFEHEIDKNKSKRVQGISLAVQDSSI